MAKSRTQIAFGTSSRLDTAIESKVIDEKDLFCLSDNDQMGWTDENNIPHFATSRTKDDITVKGVEGLGLSNKEIIPAGSSIDEVVQMLVQKIVHPEYKLPTISMVSTGDSDEDKEVGSSINLALKVDFTQNDAGVASKITISKDGESISEFVEDSHTYYASLQLTDKPIEYFATAEYNDGAIKQNNLDEDDSTGAIKAGSIESKKITFTGKYYNFFGTVNEAKSEFTSDEIRALDKSFNKSFTIAVPIGGQTIVFAIPADIELSKVGYREIGGMSIASKFTKTGMQVADAAGNMKVYSLYTYSMKVGAATNMTIDVEVL